MLKLRRFIILGLLCTLTAMHSAQAEVIRQFQVDVQMHDDTSFDVFENIVYDFEGAQRHGIYRIIPVRYFRNGGRYTIYLNVQSVTNGEGGKLQYSQSRQGNDLNIKIGDPDAYVTGVQTYRIKYQVRRAVNFFDGQPEVYWNATGDQWPALIQSAVARFFPPPNVKASQLRITSFRGVPGSKTPAQSQLGSNFAQFSTTNLQAGEGLTFVVGMPQGSVKQPSTVQNLLWLLADWWPTVLFPLLTSIVLFSLWSNTGRDEMAVGAVGVEWSPPKHLSPAEVGTLVDESCDMADIVSTLVDLAARGYLRIEEIRSEGFLFLSSTDYKFTKTAPAPGTPPLAKHEQIFYDGVFGGTSLLGSQAQSVMLSDLKEKFYVHLPSIRDAIYNGLVQKKIFNTNPETVRNSYMGIGIVVLIIGVFGGFLGFAHGLVAYGAGMALAGFLIMLSAKAMPSRTKEGVLALRECLGFQRFVRMAEKDRIAVLAKDDPTIFGRLLPFAMVLGVADQWANAFQGLMTEPPDWYVPYGYGHGYMFNSRHFVNDLGSGMNTMGNTFSSTPAAQGGGGGSSGFSSGGSSGGGFGGGGGGSW